jgi:hypothetical protein
MSALDSPTTTTDLAEFGLQALRLCVRLADKLQPATRNEILGGLPFSQLELALLCDAPTAPREMPFGSVATSPGVKPYRAPQYRELVRARIQDWIAEADTSGQPFVTFSAELLGAAGVHDATNEH